MAFGIPSLLCKSEEKGVKLSRYSVSLIECLQQDSHMMHRLFCSGRDIRLECNEIPPLSIAGSLTMLMCSRYCIYRNKAMKHMLNQMPFFLLASTIIFSRRMEQMWGVYTFYAKSFQSYSFFTCFWRC